MYAYLWLDQQVKQYEETEQTDKLLWNKLLGMEFNAYLSYTPVFVAICSFAPNFHFAWT